MRALYKEVAFLCPKQARVKLQLRDRDGSFLSSAEELAAIQGYFTDLFTNNLPLPEPVVLEAPIHFSVDEVEHSLRQLRPRARSRSPVSTGSAGGAGPSPAPSRRAPEPCSRNAPLDIRGSASDDGYGASRATDASLSSIEENVMGLCQDAEQLQGRARFVQQLLASLQNDLDAERAATL